MIFPGLRLHRRVPLHPSDLERTTCSCGWSTTITGLDAYDELHRHVEDARGLIACVWCQNGQVISFQHESGWADCSACGGIGWREPETRVFCRCGRSGALVGGLVILHTIDEPGVCTAQCVFCKRDANAGVGGEVVRLRATTAHPGCVSDFAYEDRDEEEYEWWTA